MRILLHMCCGPCSVVPVKRLAAEGMSIMGFFYRHNIHPFTECMKREEAATALADVAGFKIIYQKDYQLRDFLRRAVFRETDRCRICYHHRLKTTALLAKRGKFDAWTSSLLYSKFQRHDLIREIGEAEGKAADVPFYYEDFRTGWKEGITESRRLGLYRQSYCGCVYSEADRYAS